MKNYFLLTLLLFTTLETKAQTLSGIVTGIESVVTIGLTTLLVAGTAVLSGLILVGLINVVLKIIRYGCYRHQTLLNSTYSARLYRGYTTHENIPQISQTK